VPSQTPADPVFDLNGVAYGPLRRSTVVVCVDGGDPAYIDAAIARGIVPTIARWMKVGFFAIADGVMPSFTCPNNISIVTGAEPEVHGILGNFHLDRATGIPVPTTDPGLLRSRSILAGYAAAGYRVAAITAKDKLREQLQVGIEPGRGGICFSAQLVDRCTMAENGIEDVLAMVGMEMPAMYSAELSLLVLEAGVRLLERQAVDLMYLSLTDWVQHTYAPEAPEALDYYARMDDAFGRLAGLGAVVAVTSDHGMNDKATADGEPNVVWLQDVLDAAVGPGRTTVICPITDPFVAHHGALGGLVRVYLQDGMDADVVVRIAERLPGVESAWARAAAAARFHQPLDLEADVVVLGDVGTCIGSSAAGHDLTQLQGHRLRSHGSLSELRVPFILSEPLSSDYAARAAAGGLRSFQIFDYAIDGTAT
jgi:phosphonoacetate hydrolase